LFDGNFRKGVETGVRPVGSALRKLGIKADHLTGLGLILAGCCAVAIGTGRLGLGLGLLISSSVPDMLDGAVAKASGTASSRGAFFDSTADRVSDSLVLGGIAWYLASTKGAHAALLPFAVLGVSTLVSYERAKAESLGYQAKGGLMERAERVIVLCVGVAFSFILVQLLWAMLALTAITAVQRFVKVWRQAGRPPAAIKPEARPPIRVSQRWREWKAAASSIDWPSRTNRRERPAKRVGERRQLLRGRTRP
jgi:CDP-diacylglycerol---glycerol-3-phosphate 3-phosphatidyltransferase